MSAGWMAYTGRRTDDGKEIRHKKVRPMRKTRSKVRVPIRKHPKPVQVADDIDEIFP